MNDRVFTSYAVLGSGRLARHLAHYLSLLNLPYKTWNRRENSSAQLTDVIQSSSHALFAIKDDAITVLSQPYIDTKTQLVHFSGALQTPGVSSAHPLMTFGTELQDLSWYKNIPFVLQSSHTLPVLLPGLPNQSWTIEDYKSGHYHALCSLAGNSTFLLLQKIGEQFESQLGLPRSILQPFLHQTISNSATNNFDNFTGPVARGDWSIVQQHLAQFAESPELAHAYQSYLEMAHELGYPIPEVLR